MSTYFSTTSVALSGHGKLLLGSDGDEQSRVFCIDEKLGTCVFGTDPKLGTCVFGTDPKSLRLPYRNEQRRSFTLDERNTTNASMSKQSIYGKSGELMQRTASSPSLPLRRSDISPPSTPRWSHSLHSTPTSSAPGTPVQTPMDALPLLTNALLSAPSELSLPTTPTSTTSSTISSSSSSSSSSSLPSSPKTKNGIGAIIGTIRQQIAYQTLQADLSTSPILLSAFEPWEKALLHSLLALSLTLLLYAAFAPEHDDGGDFIAKYSTAHF